MTVRHALLPGFAAAALLSCGGAGKEPAPRGDTAIAVAERAEKEIPGCTADESRPVAPELEAEGLVSIRAGSCQDQRLENLAILEFRDAEAAGKLRQDYSLIDDPRAKDGEVVVNGKIFCHEEFRGDRDSVSCMLVVGRYILIAGGRPGVETSGVMDERMPALARAAE